MSRIWAVFTFALLVAGSVMVWYVFTSALRGHVPPLVAAAVGVAVLFLGGLALYTRERPRPQPSERASVIIDWALTDACVHLICPCSLDATRHVDGYTFGRVRCPECGATYQLPGRMQPLQVEPGQPPVPGRVRRLRRRAQASRKQIRTAHKQIRTSRKQV